MGDIKQPDRGICLEGEAEAAECIKEKHLQMIMDTRQAGREIPAVGIPASIVGLDHARQAAEASQRSMRRAGRKSFLVPALPWR